MSNNDTPPKQDTKGTPGSSEDSGKSKEDRTCPDYFEEEDPKEKEQIKRARMNAGLFGIVTVVIGLALVYFGYTFLASGDSAISFFGNAMFLGGLVFLFFGGGTIITALSPPQEPEPIKIITELRCTKCEYKATRDFKRGDHIFLEIDSCVKCKAPTYIWAIYSDPPLSDAEKKILAEDL